MKRLFIIGLLCGFLAAASAHAATITVTNPNDSGPGSLRDAIALSSSGDTIQFDAALAGTPIVLTSGELVIDKELSIAGLGQVLTILDGNGASRIFRIEPPAVVTLSMLTIRNGFWQETGTGPYGPGIVSEGGGIRNSGTLTLSDSSVEGNMVSFRVCHPDYCQWQSSLSIRGGGIYNSGTLAVLRSSISRNEGIGDPGYGGGIYNSGQASLIETAISDNTGYWDRYAGLKGMGLFNDSAGSMLLSASTVTNNSGGSSPALLNYGTLSLSGCTVAGNRGWGTNGIGNMGTAILTDTLITGNSPGVGSPSGALWNRGSLTLLRSTVWGNTSEGTGGIFNGIGGTMRVINSTIGQNEANRGGGGFWNSGSLILIGSTVTGNFGWGGGIYAVDAGNVTRVRETLLAGNTDRELTPQDCEGNIVSLGHNALGAGQRCAGIGGAAGDLSGVDWEISLENNGRYPWGRLNLNLADNGGPTPTVALLPGSPAIDAIPPSDCTDDQGNPLTTDQRDVPRPQGPACDVGAFEFSWPRGAGFWAHQCSGKGYQQVSSEELQVLFNKIADNSSVFPECDAIGCEALDPTVSRNDIRARAQQALLDVWLNLVSGRLTRGRPIDFPDLTAATTVGDAISQLEMTVCDPDASRSELGNAKDLADALDGSPDDMELAAQEEAVTLLPGASRTVTLGLVNLSPGNRNYSLTASGPWPIQLSTTRVNALGSGEVAQVTATITAPRDAQVTTARVHIAARDLLSQGTLSREVVLTLTLAGTAPPDPAPLQRPRLTD